jgi:hypothetical protein
MFQPAKPSSGDLTYSFDQTVNKNFYNLIYSNFLVKSIVQWPEDDSVRRNM